MNSPNRVRTIDAPSTWKPYRLVYKDSRGKTLKGMMIYYFEDGVEQGMRGVGVDSNVINTSTKGRKWSEDLMNSLVRV